ncbi:uncharacterized protein ATC70_006500 [Mucor velutinosus]|uniref:Uncharacterized protein n=1 Tax=Mucor velutinosus TaxID=708070 RepID=A0AAN7DNJ7_9FUNG|nr:hypothetical protein ATC70_006500 [Mucor velutinosus]
MAVNEEYYQRLSLPPVPPLPSPSSIKSPTRLVFHRRYQETEHEKQLREIISQVNCDDLQQRLKFAMDKIVTCWTDKHDAMIDALDQLEKARKKLEHRFNVQSQNYERSLRETQLYKSRLEQLQQQKAIYSSRRRSILSSNASCISSKSFLSSSSARSSSSCSSSIRQSFSLADEIIDPILFDSHLLVDSDNDEDIDTNNNNAFEPYSALSDPGPSTLPLSPNITPVPSPLSLKPPINDGNSSAAIAPAAKHPETPPEDILTFACGDGFWNTIARGKADKAGVDALVGNYIRRGGNPNVAKNSDSVKSVKEGYGLIHALIAVKNTSALQRVIDAGAKTSVYPLTSKKEDRITPIVLAAKLGYMNGVRLLKEHGDASILNDRGPYGENALHAAVQSGSDEMAGYILRLSQNALLDMADDNGATPLHYACITGKTRLITLFVRDCQAKPDPRDKKGETPLHYAVRNRKLKVIAKLVGELGVYPNPYILKQVPTPLDLAKSGGLKTIAEYLRRVGAKTTKEMEKASRNNGATNTHSVHSSNSSTFSGESSASGDSHSSPSTAVVGVRQYLHTKTSQILRGTFDL